LEKLVICQKGNDPYLTTARALKLLDIDEVVSKDDKVCIKPNLCVNEHPSTGVTTHPEVIEAIIDWISVKTKNIFIIESDTPATRTTADQNFLECGYSYLRKKNVKFLNLSKDIHKLVHTKDGLASESYLLSETLLKMDVLINVPVFKTHNLTAVTLGFKNLFGLLSKGDRSHFHRDIWDAIDRKTLHINRRIDNVLLDLYMIFKEKIKLTVIDGIIGSEGYCGVIFGNPVNLNLICAGYDLFSTDYIGARIMGINPEKLAYLIKANEIGVGNFCEKIHIFGEKISKVKNSFDLGFKDAFKIMEALFNGYNDYKYLENLNIKNLDLILNFLHKFGYIILKDKTINIKCSLFMNYLLGRTSLLNLP
jgi:uncharacterized protein (DUF362 family)